MERSRCPECGSGIGGSGHALTGGNQHSSFGGGGRPAWDPDNY